MEYPQAYRNLSDKEKNIVIQLGLGCYRHLGFEVIHTATFDEVVVIRNSAGVELNLVVNANSAEGDHNILMDSEIKYPGHTHLALRVSSITETLEILKI